MAPFAAESYGNSSGVHGVSRAAKNALEDARDRIAHLIGAQPLEIVFTSGGTESDNLALKGLAWNGSERDGVVTVATEHEAILDTVDLLDRFGHPTEIVGVGSDGLVKLDRLVGSLNESTAVVSMMLVNNETGVIQDVAKAVAAVREVDADVRFHTDAVQAFGSEEVDVDILGVDMMTITGHKFGGPKGTGLLYVRQGTSLEPLIHGGGQELGRRSGTHDVAGAVGLAAAMEGAACDREEFRNAVGQVRDDFEKRLIASIGDAVVNTPETNRSSHHLNVRFPGIRNETLLMRLDQAGVAASAGSACQSGAASVSHVLEAMGLSSAEARESVRFSFGWNNTLDESADAADVTIELVESLR